MSWKLTDMNSGGPGEWEMCFSLLERPSQRMACWQFFLFYLMAAPAQLPLLIVTKEVWAKDRGSLSNNPYPNRF